MVKQNKTKGLCKRGLGRDGFGWVSLEQQESCSDVQASHGVVMAFSCARTAQSKQAGCDPMNQFDLL